MFDFLSRGASPKRIKLGISQILGDEAAALDFYQVFQAEPGVLRARAQYVRVFFLSWVAFDVAQGYGDAFSRRVFDAASDYILPESFRRTTLPLGEITNVSIEAIELNEFLNTRGRGIPYGIFLLNRQTTTTEQVKAILKLAVNLGEVVSELGGIRSRQFARIKASLPADLDSHQRALLFLLLAGEALAEQIHGYPALADPTTARKFQVCLAPQFTRMQDFIRDCRSG